MNPIFHGPQNPFRWPRMSDKAPEPGTASNDLLSQKVLGVVRETLQADPEWMVQHRHGFTWWPGRFGLHVWIETAPDARSFPSLRLCLESDLLREVDWTVAALTELSLINESAALAGLVADLRNRRLCCRSTVYFSADTLAQKLPVIRLAAGVLPVRAQRLVDLGCDRRFGGKLHVSPHPALGLRRGSHAGPMRAARLLNVPGGSPPALASSDFEALKTMSPEPWILATASAGGFMAEFPFASWNPFQFGRSPDGTAVLKIRSDEPHPEFGSGAAFRLLLPSRLNSDQCWKRSAQLNFRENHEWTGFDSIGAWSGDPSSGSLSWKTFVPSTGRPRDILTTLVRGVCGRVQWAKSVAVGGSPSV